MVVTPTEAHSIQEATMDPTSQREAENHPMIVIQTRTPFIQTHTMIPKGLMIQDHIDQKEVRDQVAGHPMIATPTEAHITREVATDPIVHEEVEKSLIGRKEAEGRPTLVTPTKTHSIQVAATKIMAPKPTTKWLQARRPFHQKKQKQKIKE